MRDKASWKFVGLFSAALVIGKMVSHQTAVDLLLISLFGGIYWIIQELICMRDALKRIEDRFPHETK